MLSITHRMTGVALSFGFVVLVFWLFAAILGDEYFHLFMNFFKTWVGKILLVGWTWSLFYHMCNGVRHLAWDAGFGFALKTVTRSGWTVVITSTLLTAASWWWGFCCSACTCGAS